jgi:sulfur carrier protein ThiS
LLKQKKMYYGEAEEHSMRVRVRVHAYLRQSLSARHKFLNGETWDVPEGATAAQAVALLGLPKTFPVIVMINGTPCQDPARTLLKEEDIVVVLPVMAGG